MKGAGEWIDLDSLFGMSLARSLRSALAGNATRLVLPWSHRHVEAFCKSHVRQFSRNGVGRGYLVAVPVSSWHLRDLRGCSEVHVVKVRTSWHICFTFQYDRDVDTVITTKTPPPPTPFSRKLLCKTHIHSHTHTNTQRTHIAHHVYVLHGIVCLCKCALCFF